MSTFKVTSKEIIFETLIYVYILIIATSPIFPLSPITFPFHFHVFLNSLSAVSAASYGHGCSIIHQSMHRLSRTTVLKVPNCSSTEAISCQSIAPQIRLRFHVPFPHLCFTSTGLILCRYGASSHHSIAALSSCEQHI